MIGINFLLERIHNQMFEGPMVRTVFPVLIEVGTEANIGGIHSLAVDSELYSGRKGAEH